MIPDELPPPDACPSCHPGIPDAALPLGPVTETGGRRVADYQCLVCETAWSTEFDVYGWVIERLIAPVAPAGWPLTATEKAA